MRGAITGQSRQWWRILMFVSIGVIALGLRLFFIFHVSQVEIVWDTGLYWDATRQVRNFWCETLSICTSDIREVITFSDVMTFAYSREGVLPIIMGGLLAFLNGCTYCLATYPSVMGRVSGGIAHRNLCAGYH